MGGVAPIVFSYHEDIDEKLAESFGRDFAKLIMMAWQYVDQPATAYVDSNVGMLVTSSLLFFQT